MAAIRYFKFAAAKRPGLPFPIVRTAAHSPVKISKVIKELKQKDYITQAVNQEDGRGLLTSLTETGLDFLRTVDAGHTFLYKTAAQNFSSEEQQLFTQLANKLILALEEERSRKQ